MMSAEPRGNTKQEPGRINYSDEELRAVAVATSVRHRQQIRFVVTLEEVLISEPLAVDRLAAGSLYFDVSMLLPCMFGLKWGVVRFRR
jgi:hypothetical protein